MAALTEGPSEIAFPLDSLDTRSCAAVCRALGAVIEEERTFDPVCPNPADSEGKKLTGWRIRGTKPGTPVPREALDVGNSGTTLFLALAGASLWDRPVHFTGDEQIRRRSAGPLLDALAGLGVKTESGAHGCPPLSVEGPWRGGRVSLPCPTSQYLSGILLAAPLAPAGTVTEIDVPLLNERPYIELTLAYLDALGVAYEKAEDFSYFRIPGGGVYRPLTGGVPGDFSSGAFPGGAGAVSGGGVTLLGLDPEDLQGDKVFFTLLSRMGAKVRWEGGNLEVLPGPLRGGAFDLNACPDLLPIMAVLGARAEGETILYNVPHARIKETDRIAVMAQELGNLGISAEERPEGLRIQGGVPRAGRVHSQGDHRIAMALGVLALFAAGPVEITGAEAGDVTYPGFWERLGARCVSS